MARKRKTLPKDNYLAARMLGGSMMAVVLIVFGFVLGNMFGQKDGHDSTTARAETPPGKTAQPRPSIGATRPPSRNGEPKYTFYKELQERQRELERGGITAPPPPPAPETAALRPGRTQTEAAAKPKAVKKPAAERLTEKPAAKPAAEKAAKTLTEPAKPVKKTAAERLTAPPEAGGKTVAKADAKAPKADNKTDAAAKTAARAETAAKSGKGDGKQPANSRLTAPPEAVGKTAAKAEAKPAGKDGKEAATSGRDGKDKDAKKSRPVTGKRTNYRIQVGAFKNRAQAEQLRAKMAQRGLPVDIRPSGDGNKLYLVQIGPYASESQATGIQAKLKAEGQAAQLKTFNSAPDK